MANFKPFSLAEAMQAGQQMAMNTMKINSAIKSGEDETKAAGLRQRAFEGDHEALGQLMAMDPKKAGDLMTALNTMDDRGRNEAKMKNEAIAKGIMYVMQAPSEQERAQRWDATIDHLVGQGMDDLSKLKGKYSQNNAQTALMQAMTLDQLLNREKGTFGSAKPGLDKNGNPVFFTTDEQGKSKIIPDVKPTDEDLYGKSGGKGGARPIKAADSNAIANAVGSELNVPFSKLPDGSIKFQFATDEQAKRVTEVSSRAEQIFINNKDMGHREAVLQARKEYDANKTPETPGTPKPAGGAEKNPNDPASMRQWLNKQKS